MEPIEKLRTSTQPLVRGARLLALSEEAGVEAAPVAAIFQTNALTPQ